MRGIANEYTVEEMNLEDKFEREFILEQDESEE